MAGALAPNAVLDPVYNSDDHTRTTPAPLAPGLVDVAPVDRAHNVTILMSDKRGGWNVEFQRFDPSPCIRRLPFSGLCTSVPNPLVPHAPHMDFPHWK